MSEQRRYTAEEAAEIADRAVLESMLEEGCSWADAIRAKIREAFAPAPAPEGEPVEERVALRIVAPGTVLDGMEFTGVLASAAPCLNAEPVGWVAWTDAGACYMWSRRPHRTGRGWSAENGCLRCARLDNNGTWADEPRPLYFAPPQPSPEPDDQPSREALLEAVVHRVLSAQIWRTTEDRRRELGIEGRDAPWAGTGLAVYNWMLEPLSGAPLPPRYTQEERDAAVAEARVDGRRQAHDIVLAKINGDLSGEAWPLIESALAVRDKRVREEGVATMRDLAVEAIEKTVSNSPGSPGLREIMDAILRRDERVAQDLRQQPGSAAVRELVDVAEMAVRMFQGYQNCGETEPHRQLYWAGRKALSALQQPTPAPVPEVVEKAMAVVEAALEWMKSPCEQPSPSEYKWGVARIALGDACGALLAADPSGTWRQALAGATGGEREPVEPVVVRAVQDDDGGDGVPAVRGVRPGHQSDLPQVPRLRQGRLDTAGGTDRQGGDR